MVGSSIFFGIYMSIWVFVWGFKVIWLGEMSFIIGWKVNCEVFFYYDVIFFFICYKMVSDIIVEYVEFNGIIFVEIYF